MSGVICSRPEFKRAATEQPK